MQVERKSSVFASMRSRRLSNCGGRLFVISMVQAAQQMLSSIGSMSQGSAGRRENRELLASVRGTPTKQGTQPDVR